MSAMTNFTPFFCKSCESAEVFAARNEKWIGRAVLAGFLAVCLCVIRNNGWLGQDFFTTHFIYTQQYLTNPGVWSKPLDRRPRGKPSVMLQLFTRTLYCRLIVA